MAFPCGSRTDGLSSTMTVAFMQAHCNYGAVIDQIPLPCVAAYSFPSGPTWMYITGVYGAPLPRRDQWAPSSVEISVARSVATISFPLRTTMRFAGMSGKLPLTFVHVVPPP